MRLLCLILFVSYHTLCSCQANDTVIHQPFLDTSLKASDVITIGRVNITGNKRTKGFIILREMLLKQGDTLNIKELNKRLEQSRNQVFNTALFVDVTAYAAERKGDTVNINVAVKERWYFFPLPYFRLVDRNFNQWLVDQKASLERVNYGIKFTQANLTGRNDELNIWLITGYNQQVNLRYNLPFFDRKLKSGINIGFVHSNQKELNYNTGFNKQLFFKDQKFSRSITRYDATYSYRPDQFYRHAFSASYTTESITDTVLKVNPIYFPELRTRIEYPTFTYSFGYAKTDYNEYPSTGLIAGAYISKRGLTDITGLWQVGGHALYAVPLSSTAFMHFEGAATVKFTDDKNYYFNQRLFGYGDFTMHGLEYYVVDGTVGLLGKTSIHKQVFKYIFKNPFKSKTHDLIPFRFYLSAFGDLGYAYNKYPGNSLLNNKAIYSGGFGLNIVSIYDFVFRIEYSFNQLGTHGLYLHSRD